MCSSSPRTTTPRHGNRGRTKITLPSTRYLDVFRPAFLNSSLHHGLWASVKGTQMISQALYEAVGRRTQARFGRSMSLHLFRDAAATFWAENEPGQIGVVRELLGHADHSDRQHVESYEALTAPF